MDDDNFKHISHRYREMPGVRTDLEKDKLCYVYSSLYLIDDESTILENSASFLGHSGVEVKTATDGEEALANIESEAVSGLSYLRGGGSPLILESLDKVQPNEKTHIYSNYNDGIQWIGC